MLDRRLIVLCAAAVFAAGCQKSSSEAERYQAPPKFVVETIAPASQTGSLIALTFDSLGRPVVSKERGGPTIMSDKDGDGKYETEKAFSNKVKSCQGLWFDGRTLYGSCNDEGGQIGLYRMSDTNGDDAADTFDRVSILERRIGEHGPHAIRRGPDGAPTIIIGNHSGVPAELLDPQSPFRQYNESQLIERYNDARGHAANITAPGGTVSRINMNQIDAAMKVAVTRTEEDMRTPMTPKQVPSQAPLYTQLYGGFRNAYDHAYNLDGEAFVFDSDMEWDINLPWYRDVRTVHGVPGADYGWRTGSGKFPGYFLDSLPPTREVGRGSPVGVEFYQHTAYPPSYRDALLEADWSRGRILISNLKKKGATYQGEATAREFLHGEPLNVTDIEVGPDGFLWFTTGGRDTEGGLYRVRYEPGYLESLFNRPAKAEGILAVVRQPQPLSSWGYERQRQAKEKMGEAWGKQLDALARDGNATSADRVQALFLLQRFGPSPRAELLRPLSKDRDAGVRAAAVYVVGLHKSDRAKAIATEALADKDALVRRRAAEAVVRMGFSPVEQLYPLLDDSDRFVRYAARLALERGDRNAWKDRVLHESNGNGALDGLYGLVRTAANEADLEPVLARSMEWAKRGDLSTEDQLRALRLIGLVSMGYKDGLKPELRRELHEALIGRFPAQDERLSRELARTLAYCNQPEAIGKILAAMPKDDHNQQLQIHYAYCLRSITNGWTKEQKMQVLNWYPKAAQWRGGSSFTGFINLLFESNLKVFDEAEKKIAYERVPEFAPLPQGEEALRLLRPGQTARPNVLARRKGLESVSAQEIMEFQMFDPMTLKAKADDGAQLFEKECATCHRFGGIGKDFGPDLTTLNSRFKKKDILEAILWPSKTISDQYGSKIVTTKDGDIINGLIVSEDDKRVVVKTAEVERPIEIARSNVRSIRPSQISIMPENLLTPYGMNQVSNLIAYLQRGPKK
ncbi:MAG: HEAT repeat domain-containing protein [Acidobacteria bacterium]|nr:HEAT repeat domain-containing protein [Acidobacteriota bacterium]